MADEGQDCDALVIGAGPAGLMAAEALADAGRRVIVADAKPSVARKFLMAGKSGLNLTRIEEEGAFLARYAQDAAPLAPMIAALGPAAVRDWAEGLGQQTFTGSTGRLFPTVMKASPLLRAWLARLDGKGVARRTRWRWQGWDGAAARFDTPDGQRLLAPRVTVLALGGASWARLGSDGHWTAALIDAGIATLPFRPSNAGVAVAWSDYMRPHFGKPLKGIRLTAGPLQSRGEIVLSRDGIEGGGIYPLCPALRDGHPLIIDLAPDMDAAALTARLEKSGHRQSLSNRLRRAARLSPAAIALLQDCARPLPTDPKALAAQIKATVIPMTGLAQMDGAISTVGGVPWAALTPDLMLRDRPGVFCAGEMIDWDAPTGGYLITACLATGLWAGRHAAAWDPAA